MSLQKNKDLVCNFIDVIWNRGETGRIEEFISPEYQVPGLGKGPEASKRNCEKFRESFPDLKITITDLVAEGDVVAAWMELEGTQEGDFKGYPPSDKFVTWWEVGFWTIEDGRIVFAKFGADMLGLRKGIGVIPPLPEDN